VAQASPLPRRHPGSWTGQEHHPSGV